jgi:hypothetical protein
MKPLITGRMIRGWELDRKYNNRITMSRSEYIAYKVMQIMKGINETTRTNRGPGSRRTRRMA